MNAPLPSGVEADLSIDRFVTEGLPFDDDVPSRSRNAHGRTGHTERRRRRGQREADKVMHNHATDRWMVSYADFITLLFAFFVVMYAMSSVNEGRYRVLSGVLSSAFSQGDRTAPGAASTSPGEPADAKPRAASSVAAVAAPAPVASIPSPAAPAPASAEIEPAGPPATTPSADPGDLVDRAEVARTAVRVQHMRQLATAIDERLQALVRDGQVQVTRGARGIAIEINAAVLFDPAHAELKPDSFVALRSLAEVLQGFVEPLQIEGHSDDVPIATREFKSNWELSAARAASVGRFLIDQGVAPARIGIAGYAEFRPLVGNANAQSRARNRRVTLVILSADDAKPQEGGRTVDGTPSERSDTPSP